MKINPLDFVLVVDDSASMVRIVANIITKVGYKNIDTANSGNEGLSLVRNTSYKLILSDWNMEPMTGLQLLQSVRKMQGAPTANDVPFVLITAESKPENIIAAKQAGVSGYIVKPFTAETLLEKIEGL
ncbi:MAG: response regulator [Rhodospirillales bacterium]|nr:response regulator [Rhodospirillales bacterium]MCB9997136.1 response regulator [Rhodospirillales bacterium]